MSGWCVPRNATHLGLVVSTVATVAVAVMSCTTPSYEFGGTDATSTVDGTDAAVVLIEPDAGVEHIATFDASPDATFDADIGPCPGKVVNLAGRPHCYFITATATTCGPTMCPVGSHPATIVSPEEDLIIVDKIRPLAPDVHVFWIGLQSRKLTTLKKDFTWVTGEVGVVDKWRVSATPAPDGSGTCVAYQFDKPNNPEFWDDRAATNPFFALCERDPAP